MKKIIVITFLAFTIGACGAEATGNAEYQINVCVKDSVVKIGSPVIVEIIRDTIIFVKENKDIGVEVITPKRIELVEQFVSEEFEEVKGIVAITVEDESKTSTDPIQMVITFNHLKFNELLQRHVSLNGIVNYDSFKKEEYKLNEYLKMLAATEPTIEWSNNKKLAYYINLYNASTISLILQNYPLKSIKDINKAWDISFVKVLGKVFSLNDIENKIIRPTFKEPRIHFAINCAAVSCPKILNKAFSEKNIATLLQENTERFLENTTIGLKQYGTKVEISKIFDWYAVDFGGKENLLKWISDHSNQDLSKSSLKGFITYNWELNNK